MDANDQNNIYDDFHSSGVDHVGQAFYDLIEQVPADGQLVVDQDAVDQLMIRLNEITGVYKSELVNADNIGADMLQQSLVDAWEAAAEFYGLVRAGRIQAPEVMQTPSFFVACEVHNFFSVLTDFNSVPNEPTLKFLFLKYTPHEGTSGDFLAVTGNSDIVGEEKVLLAQISHYFSGGYGFLVQRRVPRLFVNSSLRRLPVELFPEIAKMIYGMRE